MERLEKACSIQSILSKHQNRSPPTTDTEAAYRQFGSRRDWFSSHFSIYSTSRENKQAAATLDLSIRTSTSISAKTTNDKLRKQPDGLCNARVGDYMPIEANEPCHQPEIPRTRQWSSLTPTTDLTENLEYEYARYLGFFLTFSLTVSTHVKLGYGRG